MDFVYEATGGIKLFGCSSYSLGILRYFKYRIGSILFSKQKAMRGIYEKIAIKKVLFPTEYVNLYMDTFNGLWNEDEIVSYETAVSLVEHYVLIRNAQYEDAVRKCKL